ncbi:hypothetical protein ACFV3R_25230 [Streptomyces sp. NPDC059740]|uniref:hypothetical protein n=1 Tax=Streptomyces sp. NPDC059740 TaxID=3346926 RepID=UPI003648BD08
MLALFRRPQPQEPTVTAQPSETEQTAKPTDTAVMRFLTLGGATVDVRATRFTTRWLRPGPPYAARQPYETNGFQWECGGCGAYGREGDTYNDPNYREQREAREHANSHAEKCRALPRPTTA